MDAEAELIGKQSSRFAAIRVVAETGSTNRDLMAEAATGLAEGAVLVADHQTAGRGRQGRSWFDEPESALLVSWLLRPTGYSIGLIPLVAGMAVVDALADTGCEVGLKWPNDVLVPAEAGRKLAGILAEAAESTIDGERRLHVVVGLGLNLRFSQRPEAGDRAIDLASLTEHVPAKLDLLRNILGYVEHYLAQLEAGDEASVRAAYVARCLTLGRLVRFETPAGVVEGRATGIDDSGALQILTDGGDVVVSAGDAHHV
ncbi:MAG: biotin--[acetyl-CoA-carboxylase] ligase [Acidimicrobiales bacterium]